MHKMISISEHCSRIRDLFGVTDLEQYMTFSEWILLASSIEKLDLDISKYDYTWGICESAHEYDLAKEQILKNLLQN